MKLLVFPIILALSLPLFAEEEKKKKLGFGHDSEVGYVVTGGNSKTETFNLKQKSKYVWEMDILKLDGHYLASDAQDPTTNVTTTTAENWSGTLRYERVLTPDRFNLYAEHGWWGDRFQGIREAMKSGAGTKYYWVKSKSTEFFNELGYQYLKELLTTLRPGSTDIHPETHFIRLYTQIDYNYADNLKFGLFVEYLPEVDDFGQYRLNFSPYMTAVLSDLFSLKVSYEGKYRSEVVEVGNEYLDFTFTTALIAKY